MILWHEPSESVLRRFVRQQPGRPRPYCGAGRIGCPPPAGVRLFQARTCLGLGAAVFNRGVEAARRGAMFEEQGLRAYWSGSAPTPGETVVIATQGRMLWSLHAWRVVEVIDALGPPRRYGFTLAAIPQRNVQAEQRFLVERRDDDSVWFDHAYVVKPWSLWGRVMFFWGCRAQDLWLRKSAAAMLRAAELELHA